MSLLKTFHSHIQNYPDRRHQAALRQRIPLLEETLQANEALLEMLVDHPEKLTHEHILEARKLLQMQEPENCERLLRTLAELIIVRALELNRPVTPRFPAMAERNLLPGILQAVPVFRGIQAALTAKNINQLQGRQKIGAYLLSLVVHGGVASYSELDEILRSLLDIHTLDEHFFYDLVIQNDGAKRTRRVFLDPLSAAMLAKYHGEFRSTLLLQPVTPRSKYKSMSGALNQLCPDLAWNDFKRAMRYQPDLPGYLAARASNKLMNSDLPLPALLHAHGITPSVHEPGEPEESLDLDDAFDPVEEEPSRRSVAAKFISAPQFDALLHHFLRYPGLKEAHREPILIIYLLAYFCGMRFAEIAFLRPEDVHLHGRKRIVLREFDYSHEASDELRRRSLKSLSSARHVPLDHLPEQVIKILQRMKDAGHALLMPSAEGLQGTANRILATFFPALHPTVHTLRHCFANRITLSAGIRSCELNQIEPSALPRPVRDQLATFEATLVAHGHRLDEPCPRDLLYLAKNMGHSTPDVTVASYIHCLDVLTYLSRAFCRTKAYEQTLVGLAGINSKTYRRQMEALALGDQLPTLLPSIVVQALTPLSHATSNEPLRFPDKLVLSCRVRDSVMASGYQVAKDILSNGLSEQEIDFIDWLDKHLAHELMPAAQWATLTTLIRLDASFIALPSSFDFHALANVMRAGQMPLRNLQVKRRDVLADYVQPSNYQQIATCKSRLFLKLRWEPFASYRAMVVLFTHYCISGASTTV